jgi:TRAP-type C4-dicarboxylate transport system substrate-binding protein
VYYPECTLTSSREHYDELIAGVCDIAYTSVETKYGFQIQRATQPWMYGVPKDVVRWRIYKELCAKYPEILAEFARTKNLSLGPGMEYQLVTTKPVRTPEDIKGMSVKAMGAFADWIAAMGGEGIPMSMGEAYISLQKGIIDGVLAPYEVFKSLRLGEVADYVTVLNSTQAPYAERGMNWDTWNSLPPDIQKVFDDNSDFFASAISNAFNALNEGGIAIAKEQGVVFIEPAPEDIDRFNKYMEGVCLKSAAELDAMGYHGTEMYNDTRRLAEEYMK